MLVLTRKKGERIRIGDDVVLTIVEVRGSGKVRIGIDAPRELDITREDSFPTIQNVVEFTMGACE